MARKSIDLYFEHNWKYFELHANQRMQMFNFFIVVSTAVVAGIGSFIKDREFLSLVLLLCITLTLISFIFWKLDRRTSTLIKHVESSMREVEQSFEDEFRECKLFSNEYSIMNNTSDTTQPQLRFRHQWTYSKCFNFMFIILGGAGAAGTLFCISQYLRC